MILFVTGTDTEIGKTYIASSLVRQCVGSGIRVGVYKPVASGCEVDAAGQFGPVGQLVSDDALSLWTAAGQTESLERVCPQRFAAPLAPPAAAAAEGKTVDRQAMLDGAQWWLDRCDLLVVEGAGGLMSPLAEDCFNADLAASLQATLVVVAANRLGVINHTLQTLIAAEHYRLPVAGIVLNEVSTASDASIATNAAALRRYAQAPLWAEVACGGEIPQQIAENLKAAL
ncbi:dethiobiotin synthase [Candidatus Laterigemmans baculatus]|uniref:dethiobiotin synthase n=1 Tax=Candidatus Laterigemmans baculatus TaxID=2770505 RepID=UPI0013D97731|nr:dethiobiotin synthase [Candidatus Laterigemmans baculatus]